MPGKTQTEVWNEPLSATLGVLAETVRRVMGRFGSDRERRRRRAQALYRFEIALREEGAVSDFVYDEEQDLFRFPDGRFAFSKKLSEKGS